jgi:5'-deoxynucleotidase YfbR-like HD superfamily hydrolase
MKHLTDLFRILELTRSQPQYGYVPSDLKLNELSNLAEHHYLVTFIAWQLALHVNNNGGEVNVTKVLEYCLVHDLGELFGGDIGRSYVEVNKKARPKAKAFEAENHNFLAKFFGNESKRFRKLAKEMMEPKNDEAWVFKLADYMECAHFLRYMGYFRKQDEQILLTSVPRMVRKIKNKETKKILDDFIKLWLREIKIEKSTLEVLKQGKR